MDTGSMFPTFGIAQALFDLHRTSSTTEQPRITSGLQSQAVSEQETKKSGGDEQ